MKTLTIGNVMLQNNLILAPMAGVTDLPFRLLCSEQKAGLCGMEMVSAKAVYYGNRNTDSLMEIHPQEGPVSLQLFGSDPEIISEMAKRIEERPFAVLDINMGCPVAKVVNNGEGSALMKQPLLVGEIVEKTVKAIQKPVTVKIRKGFNDENVNAVEIARIAQESGAAAVAVHARTREQYYSGKADWDIIRQVKEALSIPVIGNGDIICGSDAQRMLAETGCDGLMVGRAARGNPWIFSEILEYLKFGGSQNGISCHGSGYRTPSAQERFETILRHMDLLLACKGDYVGIREMRKHVAWYTIGWPGSAKVRMRINEMETAEELKDILETLFFIPERANGVQV